MHSEDQTNLDAAERDKFDAVAASWWDPAGSFRPLHELNPARLRYIAQRCKLSSARVLDVGCGGGILSEALASRGAEVTGVDVAPKVLQIARMHLLESGLKVDYELSTVESLAERQPCFDHPRHGCIAETRRTVISFHPEPHANGLVAGHHWSGVRGPHPAQGNTPI